MIGIGINLWRAALSGSGPSIRLSARTIAEDSSVDDVIGTLSVANSPDGVTWTFSEAADPDNKFKIANDDELQVAASLNWEASTSHTVTITATPNVGDAISKTFTISVTNVIETPVNLTAPVITGTAEYGQTLSCSTGTWTDMAAGSYAYQWKDAEDDSNLTGETASTLVTDDYIGRSVYCTVTATNTAGNASEDSAATGVMDPIYAYATPDDDTEPVILMDFVNDEYYSSGSAVAMTDLLTGTLSRNSTGLNLNQTNIAAQGALLTAMQDTTKTFLVEVSNSVNNAYGGLISFNGTDAPLFKMNDNKLRQYLVQLDSDNTADWTGVVRAAAAVSGSGRAAVMNLATVKSSGYVYPSVTSVELGSFAGIYLFNGRLRKLAVYDKTVSNGYLRAMSGAVPFDRVGRAVFEGAASIQFASGQQVSAGNVLAYESDQPWTIAFAIKRSSAAKSGVGLVVGNVSNAPYRGYEAFIHTDGKVWCRILGGFDGFTVGDFLGAHGSTDICDDLWHLVLVTYDGSGTAAGVKIYVDGNPETMTTEIDDLTGSSVSDTAMLVGNQVGQETAFYLNGRLDWVQIHNVARNATYAATYRNASSKPPIDANVQLAYAFNEGTGTTTADASGNGYTGTLTNANQWVT